MAFLLIKELIPIPKNGKKVAVIGGGISGITTAFDLDKKGYGVTIYEKSERIGGRLWDFEGEQPFKGNYRRRVEDN